MTSLRRAKLLSFHFYIPKEGFKIQAQSFADNAPVALIIIQLLIRCQMILQSQLEFFFHEPFEDFRGAYKLFLDIKYILFLNLVRCRIDILDILHISLKFLISYRQKAL